MSVVTANKAMLAAHGLELATLAERSGAQLCFEAAVGGGIPVIKTLRESLAGNAIQRVSGILNGTCNYILSRMETENLPFEVCLSEAQRLGYAEADPTFDVGGFDTAHKLAILASLAFGAKIDAGAVSVEGIETITLADLSAADELGFRIKLLGVAERTAHGVEQRVHPTMVAKSAPLAQTMGVLNAVSIDGDAIGELTLVGPGAGGDATASAVAADIVDIARGVRVPPFGRPAASLVEADRVPMQRHEGGYYVRLAVVDRPGAMGAIAARMGEQLISLEAIMQKRATKEAAAAGVVPVVVDDPRHDRSVDPRGARADRRGRGGAREAAGHPHRTGSGAEFAPSMVAARAEAEDEDRRMRFVAIALMCATMICFTGQDTCAKWLSASLPIAQIVWARYIGAAVIALVASRSLSRPAILRSRRPRLQLLRSVLLFCSTTANVFAVRELQLSETATISFLTPVFVALLAGPVLGERVGGERMIAIALGFLGVVIATRPGTAAFQPIVLLAIAGRCL